MKVLFLTGMHSTPEYPTRGIIIERLGKALQRLGIDVVWGKLGDGRAGARYLGAFPLTRRFIRSVRPDLIHVHFGYSGIGLPPTRIPIVTSFYGDDLNGTWNPTGGLTLKSRLGILVSQYVAWRSARCVVVSDGMVARLWGRSTRARVSVIRDAVDASVFHPLPRSEARARLGLGEKRILVMFPHDRRNPNKRIELALAGVEHLKARIPNAELWTVNEVPAAEMPLYYAAADVMVVTSAIEGGPSSAKEALACGIPVVTVPVGDMQLPIDAPKAVTVVDPTPEAIAGGLNRALQQSAGRSGSMLPSSLMLDVTAKRFAATYAALLGRSHDVNQ